MRSLLFGVTFFSIVVSANIALACGGGGEPSSRWALDQKVYSGENGLPFLSPGNDSRLNLRYLMADAGSKEIPTPIPGSANPNINLDSPVLFSRFDIDSEANPGSGDAPGEGGANPSSPIQGEGSRCQSLEAGKLSFLAAIESEPGLSGLERDLLSHARSRITPKCAAGGVDDTSLADILPVDPQTSAAARAFTAYLHGAVDFYQGAYDQAVVRFRGLARADNAWLRETARYMVARTLLNKAQVGAFAPFDEVAVPKVTDRDSLAAAGTEFDSYLTAYPAGRYAASARGLLRRVYWLGGDKAKLSSEYGRLIAHWNPGCGIGKTDLVQEIDSKFLLSAVENSHDPNLLAADDLMRMRTADPQFGIFSAAVIDQQANDFVGHEALFSLLKAARAYYVDGDFAATLALLGPAPTSTPLTAQYLDFSREVLRGQVLMASGRLQDAVDHWRWLLPQASQPVQNEAVELGLALSWERSGMLNKVFLPATHIVSPRIRGILLRQSAGPILLRMAVADPESPAERKLARFVLLFKEATRGQYAGFLRDYTAEGLASDVKVNSNLMMTYPEAILWRGSSEPYPCPALKEIVGELAADPRSAHGLLCLGEFVRVSKLDGFEDGRKAPDELGGVKPIFPGEPYARGEVYKKLIADPKTPDADRAYALYRAVTCYASSGGNHCGGADVEKPQRKAWYDLLRSRYGDTKWAQSLRYWW